MPEPTPEPEDGVFDGWYMTSSERVVFKPQSDVLGNIGPDTCGWYIQSREGEPEWWYEGEPIVGRRLYPSVFGATNERISLVRVYGALSEEGQYGHFGMYPRLLTGEKVEARTCETFAQLGQCLVPETDDACVFPDPAQNVERPSKIETSFNFYPNIAAKPGNIGTYEAKVIYNGDISEGRTDIIVRFELPLALGDHRDGLERVLRVSEDEALVTIVRKEYGFTIAETVFEPGQVRGWISQLEPPVNIDGLSVLPPTYKWNLEAQNERGQWVRVFGGGTLLGI